MRDSLLARSLACASSKPTLAHLSEVTGHHKCDFFLSEFMFDHKTNLVYQFLYNITFIISNFYVNCRECKPENGEA